jgi:hypothetical protein
MVSPAIAVWPSATNLGHTDAAVRGRDYQRIALIVLACLVELGIDELAGPIGDAVDPSCGGTAVHMTIENAHEDRDPRQRPVAQAEFGWRQNTHDHGDAPIRGRHHDTVSHRRHADGIAEKQRAPDGQQRADPPQWRPQQEQDQAHEGKAADEEIAFGMNRRDLRANGIGYRHENSLTACELTIHSLGRGPLPCKGRSVKNHSAAAGVTSESSTGGGSRLGASFSSAIRASFSRAS